MSRRAYNVGDQPVHGYRLLEFLGRGGFGEVWKAAGPGGIEVALKVIFDLGSKKSRKELRALHLLKRIHHPNLAPITAFWLKDQAGRVLDNDIVEAADADVAMKTTVALPTGQPLPEPDELIIAMGLAEMSLFDRLTQCKQQQQPGLPLDELLGYMDDAARALDYLNGSYDIQHCDVKPQNILVLGGAAQVCDFGLATSIGDLRQTSMNALSIAYAAPEVFDRRGPSHATDQCSLAFSYYELRTGSMPYEAEESVIEVIDAKRKGTLDFSKLPAAEAEVIRKATAPEADDRFATAREMVAELARRAGNDALPLVALGDSQVGLGREVPASDTDTSHVLQGGSSVLEAPSSASAASGLSSSVAATPSAIVRRAGSAETVRRWASGTDYPSVGIDLGTTFSAIAHIDEAGRPITLPNAEGELTTPSVVFIDGTDVVVGKEAVKAMAAEGGHVADCVKRSIGRELFDKQLGGRRYPPEVLEALVLRKLADDARKLIGDFDKVVITVPAYFDEVRRKATQDAGYIAGLSVLDIINEPTSAAVSYGFQQGFLNAQGEASAPQKILVYDLGGGTFDVTVMEVSGARFTALATDGDAELGGHDWDQRLVNLVAEQHLATHGIDPRLDPAAEARLRRECEDAKRTLSARRKANIAFEFHGQGTRLEVTREQFEELTCDLLDRTRFTVRQALQATGLDWGAIDRVLLVGGSSRMPMVRRMLEELSGRKPDASISVDEAVAHGAALHAALLLSRQGDGAGEFKIKNVNAHSLGVVATEAKTGRKRNAVIIPRNTPMPVTAKRTFKTHTTGQQSVLVQIVEGDRPAAEDCTPIGRCIIRDLPPDLPAGTPVKVVFQYAANARLKVYVETATGQRAVQEIERAAGLTPEHLESWRQWVEEVSAE